MLGAAAEWHSDDTAGEGYEQGMMVLIQLQSQNPPVLLTLNVTPAHTDRQKADYNYMNMAEHDVVAAVGAAEGEF